MNMARYGNKAIRSIQERVLSGEGFFGEDFVSLTLTWKSDFMFYSHFLWEMKFEI